VASALRRRQAPLGGHWTRRRAVREPVLREIDSCGMAGVALVPRPCNLSYKAFHGGDDHGIGAVDSGNGSPSPTTYSPARGHGRRADRVSRETVAPPHLERRRVDGPLRQMRAHSSWCPDPRGKGGSIEQIQRSWASLLGAPWAFLFSPVPKSLIERRLRGADGGSRPEERARCAFLHPVLRIPEREMAWERKTRT
jgi:hypothetical protein